MGLYLLVGVGIVFALLFALNNLIKTLFRRTQIGFLDILLTFMTTLILLAGLIVAQTMPSADSRITLAALLAGAGLAAFSLIILLLEWFRPQRLNGSRGVLGLYSGLLLIIAAFAVPFAAVTIATESASASTPDPSAASDPSAETTQQAEVAPTNTALPTLTLTPSATDTPRPTRTPLATLFHFSTSTPTPSPTLVTPCVASVQYNLRLRSAPDKNADTLAVIPFGTTVDLFAHGSASANGALWWYGAYQDKQGWLDGQYMTVSSACVRLPLREAP